MTNKKEIIKIGLDLDGVLIDKPPFVSKKLLEYFYKSHKTKKLGYRYPRWKLERCFRWMLHFPFLRPPIEENLKDAREISANPRVDLYAVSSRYKFLEKRTKQWFSKNHTDYLFDEIHLNLKNEQAHEFKKRKIDELGIDIFVDDDLPLVVYLRENTKKAQILHIKKGEKTIKQLVKL